VVSDLAGVAIVALSVSLSYRFAGRLVRFVGDTGATVFLRLSSFILLCVGVSIMWSGFVDLLRAMAHA
jgi:multiple antibiotic resistance protein